MLKSAYIQKRHSKISKDSKDLRDLQTMQGLDFKVLKRHQGTQRPQNFERL